MAIKLRNKPNGDTITLHDYQNQTLDFIMRTPKCGLFLELGLGKTLITLLALEDLYYAETGHILVVAPKAIAKTTWLMEMKKWNFDMPYKSLIADEEGKDLSRKKRLTSYAEVVRNPVRTVYFINRELLADLVNNLPEINGQSIWAFQTVVVDEYQSFKSAGSKRFKALKHVSPAVNRLIGLTGTPAPQGIEDLWSELFLMDYGARLGSTLTSFRKTFMLPSFTNARGQVCSWKARPGAEPVVYDRIKDICISIKNTALNLPAKNEITDYVFLDEKERKIYNTFLKEAVLEFDENTAATACNSAVLTSKLQQLASGAIYTVDKDDKPTGEYKVIHTRKLEMLKYIRENTDDNHIVAYYFNSDLDMITKYYTEQGIPFTVYDSKKAAEIQQSWDANEVSTLFVHPASAGFGLNLQYAGYRLIWYTLSFNLEHYIQTIGRVYRQGQLLPTFIHYLLTDKTVDSKVLSSLQNKNCGQQAMLDAIEYAKMISTDKSQASSRESEGKMSAACRSGRA
jgi:SNF2 family DNA or RNA helicase